MLMDLTFLVLSTCMHLNGDFNVSKQCQTQLTACYKTTQAKHQDASPDALIGHCLLSGQVNYNTLETKPQ